MPGRDIVLVPEQGCVRVFQVEEIGHGMCPRIMGVKAQGPNFPLNLNLERIILVLPFVLRHSPSQIEERDVGSDRKAPGWAPEY